MFYFFYDFSLIILIPGILLAIFASAYVNSTYNKYNKVSSKSFYTGYDTARKILSNNDCNGVVITKTSGNLTDNYNPTNKTLSLSQSTFNSTSVASIGVAAHECGHAMQDNENYLPLLLRKILVPVTRIGSYLALPLAIIGIIIEWLGSTEVGGLVLAIGVFAYSLTAIFSLITLPVELNASRRAKKALVNEGILDSQEVDMAGKVLNAAALTYVANLAVSLLYLLRFMLIISRFRRRN